MAKINRLSQLDLNRHYSYADYMTWQLDDMIELIKGKIMLMSPAPNVKHQGISVNFTRLLANHFLHKSCKVFAAPFDVRLYDRKKSVLTSQDIHTVVQPDLCVICNPELLDSQGCNGAPDWIIEILSKGNAKREMKLKYEIYQESGVTEYWLVYPEEQAIYQFVLNDERQYRLKHMYANDDVAVPHLFPELQLDVNEIFEL
ncbi:Uma2 family endonuclease [Methylotuvimicrobium sp. KM2]|jgi:Uma2 family endonuclease|uniref:Uma2 family endonuclease n=1 Tax=Methylotuvimicrobium sp. KM2 TaxID=3133976 RepID=UPI003100B92B